VAAVKNKGWRKRKSEGDGGEINAGDDGGKSKNVWRDDGGGKSPPRAPATATAASLLCLTPRYRAILATHHAAALPLSWRHMPALRTLLLPHTHAFARRAALNHACAYCYNALLRLSRTRFCRTPVHYNHRAARAAPASRARAPRCAITLFLFARVKLSAIAASKTAARHARFANRRISRVTPHTPMQNSVWHRVAAWRTKHSRERELPTGNHRRYARKTTFQATATSIPPKTTYHLPAFRSDAHGTCDASACLSFNARQALA